MLIFGGNKNSFTKGLGNFILSEVCRAIKKFIKVAVYKISYKQPT